MEHYAPVETNVLHEHMPLVAHMARNDTTSGMPRTPGVVAITTVGRAWVVEVIDPDAVKSFTVLGLTLDGVLAVANALIDTENPPWVPMKKVPFKK